jgi:hypothetical protein
VRAIEGVEASVYGIEVTATGSIKVFTGPRSETAETKVPVSGAEAKTTKKHA